MASSSSLSPAPAPAPAPTRATDDRTGRPGDRATDKSAAHRATGATDARAAFVVTLGSLAGDGPAGRADRAAYGRAYRSADNAAYHGPADGARGAADGLRAVLALAIVLVGLCVFRHGTGVRIVEVAISIIHLMQLLSS